MAPRQVRADAVRNQAGILRDARTMIRARGLDVGIDGIAGTDRALKVAIDHLAITRPGVAEQLRDLQQRVMSTLTRIVAAAQRQGTLYPDITAGDLALLLTALPGDELPETDRQRWVQLALRGLITWQTRPVTDGELRE
jgi:hypothetical protein